MRTGQEEMARSVRNILAAGALLSLAAVLGGCGNVLPPAPARLFYLPLEIEGQSIGPAFLDTGGEFEVLLKHPQGLGIRDQVEVLAFAGRERVDYTEPFTYRVGDVELRSDGAIVGLSVCECNGVGLAFFKKSQRILHLDFPANRAELTTAAPWDAAAVALSRPDGRLASFQGLFAEVEVSGPGGVEVVHALLDSGATRTVMRDGLVGRADPLRPNQLEVTIGNPYLGTARLTAALFDMDGLPDVIIGTDLMGAWADHWYLNFNDASGFLWVTWDAAPVPGDSEASAGPSTQTR